MLLFKAPDEAEMTSKLKLGGIDKIEKVEDKEVCVCVLVPLFLLLLFVFFIFILLC